jgi:hypothetical protein
VIKRVLGFILAASLFLFLPGAGLAEDEITLLESTATVDFPAKITFNIKAESTADITRARLNYRVDKLSCASVISEAWPEFTPHPRVEASWVWDMRKASLPPGARVEYWWTVEDATGHSLETPPEFLKFEDGRYSWRGLTSEDIALFWYEGDEEFAQGLMATAEQALNRLWVDTGASLDEPVEIYIYATNQALLGAMIYPQEWAGGVTFTDYGIVAIGIAPNEASLEWGKRALPHELAHLVVHQIAFSCYGDLPAWLDEGLAMYAEGDLSREYKSILSGAISEGRLISVRSLSSPFSADPGQARLSYAQSYSLIDSLIDSYGREKMLQLLTMFRRGSGYDEALTAVYGFDMDEFDALFQAGAKVEAPVEEGEPQPIWVWVLVGLASLGVLLLGLRLAYRARR